MAVEDFANGANILQQVDVSQIFKSLAMGIAEAQQELDDNSISQLQRLSETELAGKSLLELGFVPAFYSFTYADISASIHLRMAEKTSFELGFEASFDYESGSTASAEFAELSKEKQFQSEQGEFKSNRAFSIKSSSKQQIKINNQYYKLDENVGVVSRHEKLHKELLQDSKIDRVNQQYSNSYFTVFKNISGYSIFSITNQSSADPVTVGSTNVVIATQTFAQIYAAFDAAVTSGTLYGFSGDEMFGLSTGPTKMDLHFRTDLWQLDFDYDFGLKGIDDKEKAFEALATALKNDPAMHITIEGSCDRTAKAEYNLNLSTRRCTSMRDWLVAKGASKTQVHINPRGEEIAEGDGQAENQENADYRRVRISVIPNRYYIFSTTNISVTVGTGTSFLNVPPASTDTFVVVNGNSEGFQTGTSIATYESLNTGSTNSLYESETREDIHYFLHKNTEVTYMAYSVNAEQIEVSAEEGSQSEIRVYKNENSTERIKNLAEKNSSNKRFAASASVDIRIARQFEMSIEGSASMSARMVAVPPPAQFLTHIEATFITPPTP